MSSANVSPSASEYSNTEKQTPPLEPLLPDDNSNFRLKKISDMIKKLGQQAGQNRQVAKNTKKLTKFLTTLPLHWQELRHLDWNSTNWRWCCCQRSFSHSCRRHWFRLNGLAAFCSKLQYKIAKHEKIYTLAIAKLVSVLLSLKLSRTTWSRT